jgi:pilus assembly protein CpaF
MGYTLPQRSSKHGSLISLFLPKERTGMAVLLIRIKDLVERSMDQRKFDADSVLIGRSPECQLVLSQKKVSKHHAEITVTRDGIVHVMDLRSREGVTVNGKAIESRVRISAKDVVGIGDYRLRVAAKEVDQSGGNPRAESETQSRRQKRPRRDPFEALASEPEAAPVPSAPSSRPPVAPETAAVADEDIKVDPDSIWGENAEFGFLLEFLSPIKEYLLDPDISEIMVNGPGQVYIEKSGRLILTDAKFPSDSSLISVVQNIAVSVGRKIDERNPILDARLPDGSRVNAVIMPCARRGTYIAIRKFMQGKMTIEKLIQFDAVTYHAAEFISACVRGSLNVVVSGGTGSGKTTLLNIVSDYIPESERIIVIEDASELRLGQEHLLTMETRQPDPKTGLGKVTIRDLLRTSLRLRPDRIVIGELRGEEAFDLLQAFNTGHRGSMTTVHSNGPKDSLGRLEMLVTLAGLDIPLRAIREQIASAVDMVIYTSRLHDGSRKITHITEVLPLTDAGGYATNDIFKFKRYSQDADGKIHGKLEPTGTKPTILDYFENHGIEFPSDFFTNDYEVDR